MIGFLIGLFVGGLIGVFTTAIVAVNNGKEYEYKCEEYNEHEEEQGTETPKMH